MKLESTVVVIHNIFKFYQTFLMISDNHQVWCTKTSAIVLQAYFFIFLQSLNEPTNDLLPIYTAKIQNNINVIHVRLI